MTAMLAATGMFVWHHHSGTAKKPVATQSAPATSQVQNVPIAKPSVLVKVAQPQLTTLVQTIVDQQATYQQRSDAIRALTAGKLTDADREALYEFLKEHNSDDDRQLGQVLKNQLMDALCAMEPPPQGLGDLLEQIYADRDQNAVLRDYAVQHLATFYEQMAAALGVDEQTRANELKLAQQTLWDASNETAAGSLPCSSGVGSRSGF